ncbi:YbjN domain-containing protein [Sphingomonas sp. KC8]|uniref:YbjN domain-containing protein n=1 Tax=Sphingomonas sp. KC8 TaxID=1030157 RepID=UPI0002489343|nr:YbjN domain-containing protein [Sphingomonas sp. KC8]ARS25910.1 hypothetical protein KC8_01185 [Sphingomonas sp. KC8]
MGVRGFALGMMIAALAAPAAMAPAATPKIPAKPADLPKTLAGTDLDGFVRILQDAGYRARLKTHDDGSRFIESAAGGTNFSINFNDCEGESGCTSLRFLAWWTRPASMDLTAINGWNNGYRFARATIDGDDDLVLDYYITLVGGVPAANFLDSFDWWATLLADFDKYMDEKAAGKAAPGKGSDAKGVSAADEDIAG